MHSSGTVPPFFGVRTRSLEINHCSAQEEITGSRYTSCAVVGTGGSWCSQQLSHLHHRGPSHGAGIPQLAARHWTRAIKLLHHRRRWRRANIIGRLLFRRAKQCAEVISSERRPGCPTLTRSPKRRRRWDLLEPTHPLSSHHHSHLAGWFG